MLRSFGRLHVCCAFLAAFVFAAGSSRADSISFDLDAANITGSYISPTGPFVTVGVEWTSDTTAAITFTSDTYTTGSTTYIYLMGDGGTVAVNVNATTWTISTPVLSNSGTGFTPSLKDSPNSDSWNAGAGNEDGFGSFNQNVDSNGGFTDSSDTVTFTLTDTSGTWASASDVLVDGNPAAAHIFVTEYPANAGSDAVNTGYSALGTVGVGGGQDAAPLPSVASMGFGLLGVLGMGHMIRRKSAAI